MLKKTTGAAVCLLVLCLGVPGSAADENESEAIRAATLDYSHIGTINGEWKIINVLWVMKPKPESEDKPSGD